MQNSPLSIIVLFRAWRFVRIGHADHELDEAAHKSSEHELDEASSDHAIEAASELQEAGSHEQVEASSEHAIEAPSEAEKSDDAN